MFNGIKGLTDVAAKFRGFNSVAELEASDARRARMVALGKKGARARRAKEDPVKLAIRARAAGCTDARSVAGWVRRYIDGGLAVANAGPVAPITK